MKKIISLFTLFIFTVLLFSACENEVDKETNMPNEKVQPIYTFVDDSIVWVETYGV